MRRIAVFVATLVLSVSLHAEEVFFSNIINASFLSDFAMSAFPVSFWGEFGIDHLDFMPDLNTKAVVRVEAGMAQRTLRQYPETGALITDHNPGSAENYARTSSFLGYGPYGIAGMDFRADWFASAIAGVRFNLTELFSIGAEAGYRYMIGTGKHAMSAAIAFGFSF